LKNRFLLTAILFLLVSCFSIRHTIAQSNVERSYLVIDYNGNFHTLNITVTYSLYQYYVQKRQSLEQSSSEYNPCNYVTPQAVKSIADCLLSISKDEEDFINQVLKWNRQHRYNVTKPIYPIESLYLGYGDCDTFSILVASILIAGNVTDILFLSWQLNDCLHMNLAVHLPYTPKYYTEGTGTLYWITYNNKTYYIAECTGQTKQPTEKSYMLGNLPSQLENVQVENIIPIVDYDDSYVEQVQANFVGSEENSLYISISHYIDIPLLEHITIPFIYPIIIKGKIDTNSTETVTLYYSHDNKNWNFLADVKAINGSYSFTWNILSKLYISKSLSDVHFEFIFPEKIYIKAYWGGNTEFSPASSESVSFYYIPLWLIIFIFIIIVYFIVARRC